jgi:hypothetical protein
MRPDQKGPACDRRSLSGASRRAAATFGRGGILPIGKATHLAPTKEEIPMTKLHSIVALAAGAMALCGVARADDYLISDPAALAKALAAATVQLDQGIKAAAAQGTPISAQYEFDEKGALQLSVYNAKGTQFLEVIVDYKTGTAQPGAVITDAGDLAASKAENDAMAKAKTTLEQAAAKAAADNSGYRVVAIAPALQGTSPVAAVQLMKGTEVKKVSVKLD